LIKAWEENEKTKAENKFVSNFSYSPELVFSGTIICSLQ